MRLLLTTQVVDKNDSDLGFFHEWIIRLASQFDSIEIICLKKGEYTLPNNVRVHSLDKESHPTNAFVYALRFYKLLFKLRGTYDDVFVHMNPEYAILGGAFWRFTDKKILLWYMHKSVTFKLKLAERFVTKIFTASKESFRLPSKKLEIVGHGIPTDIFSPANHSMLPVGQIKIVSIGRVSKSKNHETVIQAIAAIKNSANTTLTIVGEPITREDLEYKKQIELLALKLKVMLQIGPARFFEMPKIFQNAHILLHTSRTGSLDKVVLEALATGRIVVSTSEAVKELSTTLKSMVYYCGPGDYKAIAQTIETISQNGALQTIPNQVAIEYVRKHHDLTRLVGIIVNYFKS